VYPKCDPIMSIQNVPVCSHISTLEYVQNVISKIVAIGSYEYIVLLLY
jgi:hypothetical protein